MIGIIIPKHVHSSVANVFKVATNEWAAYDCHVIHCAQKRSHFDTLDCNKVRPSFWSHADRNTTLLL
jgi:hypothetical protein